MNHARALVLSPRLVPITSCTTLRPLAPSEYLSASHVGDVRVLSTDGCAVVMQDLRISGDTLIGEREGQVKKIPLADVPAVEARRPAPARTVAVVAGTAAALTAFVLSLQTPSPQTTHPPTEGTCRGCPDVSGP